MQRKYDTSTATVTAVAAIRATNSRRHHLPSLMWFSSVLGFGYALIIMEQRGNAFMTVVSWSNLASSGCFHIVNLYMDGKPIGLAGQCCCWLDRTVVATSVALGLWVSASWGLWPSVITTALVPVLFGVKAVLPFKERYLRTLVHCLMHQVGVGGLVYAGLATPAGIVVNEWWWPLMHTFFTAVALLQPMLALAGYQYTISIGSTSRSWIWI